MLVEAAWIAVRQPGPLHAFGERVRAKKGSQVAAVAVARKIACLAWQLLTKGEDYAYGRPSLVRGKIRQAELAAGAKPLSKRHAGQRVSATTAERDAERRLTEQAEAAYRQLINDWKAAGPIEKERRRDRRARISKAVKTASSATDSKPNACALARRHRRQTHCCTIGCKTPTRLDFHPYCKLCQTA